MKRYVFTLATVLGLVFISLAQDCKNYLFMTSNAQIQTTIYDKKGKQSGVQTWKVNEIKKDGSGLVSTISSQFQDEKGKEIASSTGVYKCNGGILQADMRMSMPQQQVESMKTSDVKMANTFLEYPYNISVGQQLKDAEMNMDVDMKSGMKSKVSFKEMNRKVAAKEKITTPAGSWDAYQISYDGNMRTEMAGIGIPFNFTVKEWFVPGLGIVKTETYAKGGKLMGSTMITSITK